MRSEIGSEFWETDIAKGEEREIGSAHQYLLSGRTALDLIIKDIQASEPIGSVAMPSYCCHTMIQPFMDNGIDVEFYNVRLQKGRYTYEVDVETSCDVILIMKYFGFASEIADQSIEEFRKRGKIIIEDATHSWFSDPPNHRKSNYVYSSLRKWTGVTGGAIALKSSGPFEINGPDRLNLRYIELRRKAARLKKQFIEEGIGEKKIFLTMFNKAEELLDKDYKGCGVPASVETGIKSLDREKIIKARKENSKILIEGLKDIKGVESVALSDKDVPLFVPIRIAKGKRNELQQYLIDNSIYCPIHWPLTDVHAIKERDLYNNCLSLICDQRYNSEDMGRIVGLIKAFYKQAGRGRRVH